MGHGWRYVQDREASVDLVARLISVQACTTSPSSLHVACHGIKLIDQASMMKSSFLRTGIEFQHPMRSSPRNRTRRLIP